MHLIGYLYEDNYVSVRTATRYELNTCGAGELFMSGISHHFPVRR